MWQPNLWCCVCSLGEEGAAAIADFVKQGKKLKELNLYMNDVGTGGAYKVSKHASLACQLISPGDSATVIWPACSARRSYLYYADGCKGLWVMHHGSGTRSLAIIMGTPH